MAKAAIVPTGRESPFGEEELLVSKTDLKGHITYVNDIFVRVSRYDRPALIGAPHSVIRHPEMPRAVFRLLWESIAAGREVFAYIVNLAANGDHYWVFAHVTPSLTLDGRVVGYHSNRRKPDAGPLAAIQPLYQTLLEIERAAPDRKVGLDRSHAHLLQTLREKATSYDEYVFSL